LTKRLSRKRALIYVGLFQAAALSAYLVPTAGWTALPVLYGASMIAQMGMCAAETMVSIVAMDRSRLDHPGSDYTLQISLMYLSGIVAMMISGFVAERIGYLGLFATCVLIALLVVVLIARCYQNPARPILDQSSRALNGTMKPIDPVAAAGKEP
jgi:MFS transporter, PAT family, beta-lactamase induction signal transducer AmpG